MHAVASIDSLFQGWVVTYGLLAILLLMTVQCVGVPFPSEVIMPVAGYLASTGRLNLVAVIVVGIAGNVVGSLIAYGLAAWLGEPVLLGPGRYIGIRAQHVDAMKTDENCLDCHKGITHQIPVDPAAKPASATDNFNIN